LSLLADDTDCAMFCAASRLDGAVPGPNPMLKGRCTAIGVMGSDLPGCSDAGKLGNAPCRILSPTGTSGLGLGAWDSKLGTWDLGLGTSDRGLWTVDCNPSSVCLTA